MPEDRGLDFDCRISDPLIELTREARPFGTRIHVRVTDPRVFDQLSSATEWDWYRMAAPSLRRTGERSVRRDRHLSSCSS